MPDVEEKKSVEIAAPAFSAMVAYAARHPSAAVHGVAVGTSDASKIVVSGVFPVCHGETPTRPLVDAALALASSSLEASEGGAKIVGWFTAPALLRDEGSGPVPLRIVSTMGGDDADKVLLVLRNAAVGDVVRGGGGVASAAIAAFGKDFGNQWMDPLEVTVPDEGDAVDAARKLYESGKGPTDLVEHWKDFPASDWSIPNV